MSYCLHFYPGNFISAWQKGARRRTWLMKLEPLGSLAARTAPQDPALAECIRLWRGGFDAFWSALSRSKRLRSAIESACSATHWFPTSAVAGTDRQVRRALRGQAPLRHGLAWECHSDDLAALAWIDFLKCVESGVTFASCPLCGSWFPRDGTRATHCPDCRTGAGKALRLQKARASLPEEARRELRRWNALRMRALREAEHSAKPGPTARKIVRLAAEGDAFLRQKITSLRPGSRLQDLLREAAWELHSDGQISLRQVKELFGV